MNAEQIIKDALDGSFFRYDPVTQKIKRTRVPKNYIPNHKPSFTMTEKKPSHNAKNWTIEEDMLLLEMRAKGMRWRQIGTALKVSFNSAANRYYELCIKRGIQPIRSFYRVYDDGAEEKVVELRRRGMMLKEVAEALGMTKNQVVNLWERYRDRMKREGKLAA